MFYAMTLKDGSYFARRRLFKQPKVIEKRVQGGLPYCLLETSIYRKRINWGEAGRICGNLKSRLLLPDNLKRPEDFPEADCKSFIKVISANTFLEIIRNSKIKDKGLSLCIADKNGDAAQKLGLFVPMIGSIVVKTQRPDLYIPEIKRAMEEYGARVRFTDCPKADIILNLDEGKCEGRAVFRLPDLQENDILNLPYSYSSLCPEGINKLKFSAFLYNFSKVSSLSSLYFDYVIIDRKKTKIKQAAQTLKRLCY